MTHSASRGLAGTALVAGLLAASCTSWQRVADPGTLTPEESLVQLFNPGQLYRQMGRLVSATGVPFVGTVAYLPGPGDSTRVLVGLSLSNRAFAFTKSGDGYEARYRVEYALTGGAGIPKRVASEATVRVPSLRESLRTDESILLQQELMVPPGGYRLAVQVADQGTHEIGSVSDSVTIPAFTPGSFTAPIFAYQVRGRAAPADSVGIVLNPRGSIAYGSDTLLIYLEGVGFTGPATVPVQVRDARDSVILRTDMHVTGGQAVESQVIRIRPDSAPLGQVQVVVGDDTHHKSNSGVISFSGNWLITNFDDLLSLLRYFGQDARVRQMREASPEGRPELWREFFHATDPNPLTPENEALDAYFGRVAAANQLFRGEGNSGWRTDRGEVYITLGPPDEVYDGSTTSAQEGRYIRWAYYDLRTALIFQDQTGFGAFRLTPESRSEFERVKNRVEATRNQ